MRRWKLALVGLDPDDRLGMLLEAGPVAVPFLSVTANAYYYGWVGGHPEQPVLEDREYDQLHGMATTISHVLGARDRATAAEDMIPAPAQRPVPSRRSRRWLWQ